MHDDTGTIRRRSPSRDALPAALLAAALLALPGVAQAGRVVEFSKGISPGAQPYAIAAGPDGSMWFTENADGVGRITPGGTITEYKTGITPGATPTGITAGPDGAVWFTENAGRIGRISSTGITEFPAGIGSGAQLNDITVGPDGYLWFTKANAIGRITPAGVVTEYTVGITPGSLPWEITAGPDGNLWFTETVGGAIGRIGLDGSIVEFRAGMRPGAAPLGIAPGPDGNVWFTDATGAIGKITPLGIITMISISKGARPTGIARGPDENLWYTDASGRIGRVTPAGSILEFTRGIDPDAGPHGIAAGHDGNLWFTERNGNRIGRIGTNTAVFYTAPATRRGNFLGEVSEVQVTEARGTLVTVVCAAGCDRRALRGKVPLNGAKPQYARLVYRPRPLRVGRRTVLEVRAVISTRVTRYERFGFRRGSGRLLPRRVGSGCARTQRPRQRVACPPG